MYHLQHRKKYISVLLSEQSGNLVCIPDCTKYIGDFLAISNLMDFRNRTRTIPGNRGPRLEPNSYDNGVCPKDFSLIISQEVQIVQ